MYDFSLLATRHYQALNTSYRTNSVDKLDKTSPPLLSDNFQNFPSYIYTMNIQNPGYDSESRTLNCANYLDWSSCLPDSRRRDWNNTHIGNYSADSMSFVCRVTHNCGNDCYCIAYVMMMVLWFRNQEKGCDLTYSVM